MTRLYDKALQKGPAGLLLFDSASLDPMERCVFVLYSQHGYKANASIARTTSVVGPDQNNPNDLCIRMIDYNGRTIKRNINVSVEGISIPRGGMHPRDGNMIVTAIREFVEETNLSPETVIIYNESFLLWWRDQGRVYQYKIFVGLLGTPTVSMFTDTKRYEYIHKPTSDSDGDQYNTIMLQRHKINKYEEKRNVIRLTLRDYLYYMINYQLNTYTESNYLDFFQFIYGIEFFSRNRWTKYTLALNTMCMNKFLNYPNRTTPREI